MNLCVNFFNLSVEDLDRIQPQCTNRMKINLCCQPVLMAQNSLDGPDRNVGAKRFSCFTATVSMQTDAEVGVRHIVAALDA